ncbi:MAG: hypothetical protein PHN88_07725 [Ignavibacteria bacterium]|nr:hypothetical protein [Ignavibacteria bacterium]
MRSSDTIKKILLTLILAAGIFATLSSKTYYLWNLLIIPELDYNSFEKSVRYGDLYRMSRVTAFKEDIPYPPPELIYNSVDESDIISAGDSFFLLPINGLKFAAALEKYSGKKIYDATQFDVEYGKRPAAMLTIKGFNRDKEKIFILECVERYSHERAKTKYLASVNEVVFKYLYLDANILSLSSAEEWLQRSVILRTPLEFKADAYFKFFRRLPEISSIYTLNPPMLFYNEDRDYAGIKPDSVYIEETANSLKKLSVLLKEKYNLVLLYVVIPNKYSLYGEYVNPDFKYNNYIPALTESLRSKGVHTFDTYTLLKENSNNELLYYRSDTHFNEKGRDLLVKECANMISLISGESEKSK